MTWISKSLTGFGLILLAHACYSAQEYSALQTASAATVASTTPATASLPVDIKIETVVAVLVVCLGLVTGSPELRPIRWRVWAGKIEREGEQGFLGGDGQVAKDYIGNPFKLLESRPGFVDIRKQRHEFTEWVKEGGTPA